MNPNDADTLSPTSYINKMKHRGYLQIDTNSGVELVSKQQVGCFQVLSFSLHPSDAP